MKLSLSRSSAVIAAALFAVAVAACSGSSSASKSNSKSLENNHPAASSAAAAATAASGAAARPASVAAGGAAQAGAPAAATTGSASTASAGDAGPITDGGAASLDRKIIRSADIGIEVKDADAAPDRIASIATGLGGYVSNSKLARVDDALRGTITVRVPVENFDQLMANLKGMASRVERENVTSQDVTEEYADLDARVQNLQATEDQIRQVLDTVRQKTNSTNDILTVYRELTNIQGQIEQAKGRQQYLSKLSDLATVSVELIPPAAPEPPKPQPQAHHAWTPERALQDAAGALASVGRFGLDALIWTGVLLLPIAAVVAIVVAALLFGGRRLLPQRRTPSAPSTP